MYEVSCPSCTVAFEYNVEDYIHLCPACSSGFALNLEEGTKEVIGDHFIIPNKTSKQQADEIFFKWLSERHHRPEKAKKEFKILGSYGASIPFWVVSIEAHTYWSGHSAKAEAYAGQATNFGSRFAREDGRFSKKYRWSTLARKSPKEHWGLERLHHPKEPINVDWDGFPFDDAMGKTLDTSLPAIYDSKMLFKFEHSSDLVISGIQVREQNAIARAKDQIQEYHRRICKTKVGTLYEHRTEVEVVGVHLVHTPFWVLRYAYIPTGMARFFSPAKEKHLLIQGYTQAVLEAELPVERSAKVFANLVVTSTLSLVSLVLAITMHPLFLLLTAFFAFISVGSVWKIFSKDVTDPDLIPGSENREPV